MEVSSQIYVPATLTPAKEPPVSIGQESSWAPELIWTRWRREKFPASAGNRTPVVQFVRNLVTTLTKLSQVPKTQAYSCYRYRNVFHALLEAQVFINQLELIIRRGVINVEAMLLTWCSV